MLLRALFISLLIAPLWPSAAQAEARIALLITNQAYRQPGAALTNTHRDGEILKTALEKVGFKVWVTKDTANEGALLKAIGEHVQRMAEAGPDAVGFFYYSGHGAADRHNGENYLIPTEVPIAHAAHLPLMAVRLERILSTFTATGKISFVVFDACRNVPLQRAEKDIGFKGFAPIREQRGLLVAYATEPGNIALDQNTYAKALAEEIVRPGVEAGQVFRAVARRVKQDTKDTQWPEYLDRRLHDFHFASAAQVIAVTPPPLAAKALTTAEERALKPKDSFKECDDCPEMVVVPAGSFTMGSPAGEEGRTENAGPQRKVTIARPFAVGKYEVTFAQWDACVAAGGCNHLPNHEGWGRGKRPVIHVSWDDITTEYLPWLSRRTGKAYRLLTEAEWEYAARAGTTTPFSTGRTITSEQANFDGYSTYGGSTRGVFRGKPVDVGSFQPNAFGLYDMHGNVSEWLEDCWHDTYQGAPTDGSPWTTGCKENLRVLRGGSWTYHPQLLRSAERNTYFPGHRGNHFGFRLARTLNP